MSNLTIAEMLNIAHHYGLQVEVVETALMEMKLNPTLSIKEALQIGFEEWIN